MSVIKRINFSFETFLQMNKKYSEQIETYCANFSLIQSRLNNNETADCSKIDIRVFMTFHKDQGLIWNKEAFSSLFSDRTNFDEDYKKHVTHHDPSTENKLKIKSGLSIKFLEAFNRNAQKG